MITNLHKATYKDRTPVAEDDLKVGLEVYMKYGSGVLRCQCVENNEDKAVFKSDNPDWPMTFEMDKTADDLTLDEFDELNKALGAFVSITRLPTEAQRSIVHRADQLGYANHISFSQAAWTQKGVDTYKALLEENDNAMTM